LGVGTATITPWFTYAIVAIIISVMVVVIRFWNPVREVFGEKPMAKQSTENDKATEKGYLSVTDWILGRKKRAK
jgi:hypothetical protein